MLWRLFPVAISIWDAALDLRNSSPAYNFDVLFSFPVLMLYDLSYAAQSVCKTML